MYDEQETHLTVGYLTENRLVNKNVLRLRMKESVDAVWCSDGGRLFQNIGLVYMKARKPAEECFAFGILYRSVRGGAAGREVLWSTCG